MGIFEGNKTDKFVKALEKAMIAAKDIPGVDVNWKISYSGPKSSVEELKTKINAMKEKLDGPVKKEPEKEEVVTDVTEG